MKTKLGAALACLLFAVSFGAVGVGASWVVARMIVDGHRAEEWVGVRANVLAFGRGNVDYTYAFRGKEYRGDRLGVNPIGGTDNVDSWHDDMYSMLSEAQAQKKPITVWVNPDNPAESMVDRTIRWKLLVFALPFALGFGGVGLGALYMFFRTLARSSEEVERQPDPLASANEKSSGLLGLWIFTFFWNVIAMPISILVVPDAVANGEWAALLVLLFPLIGVLMLWGAIAAAVRAIKAAVKARFVASPPRPVVTAKAVNDGVFARGLIDDARPAAAGAAAIDTGDDGLPAPRDPAVAQLERLSGRTLSAEQREQLEKMSPQSKAMLGKLAGWLGKVKEVQDK